MKRGTPNHPKVALFAEAIGRRRPEAIGYLELLFHFTAQYAPDGAIGRYDDRRIAAGIDWMGKPSLVIDGLVAAGWLDRHPTARLVVHDWADHCDRTTLQRLQRAGKTPIIGRPRADDGSVGGRQLADTMATAGRLHPDGGSVVGRRQVDGNQPPGQSQVNGRAATALQSIYTVQSNQPITGKVCTQSVTNENTRCELDAHLPVPEPEPVPLPEPVPPPAAFCAPPPPSPDLSGIASEIWQRHPGHRRGSRQSAEHDLAIRCAGAVDPLAVATAINRTHAECCLSEQWRSGRAMGLTRWLTEDGPGTCMSAPPPRIEPARQKSFSEQKQDQTRQKFISGLDWEKPRG